MSSTPSRAASSARAMLYSHTSRSNGFVNPPYLPNGSPSGVCTTQSMSPCSAAYPASTGSRKFTMRPTTRMPRAWSSSTAASRSYSSMTAPASWASSTEVSYQTWPASSFRSSWTVLMRPSAIICMIGSFRTGVTHV